MSIYTIKQSKVIALVLIFLVGLFLLYSLSILFEAMLASVILYVLFKPMYLFFAEKKKLNKSLSAVIIMLVTIFIIVIPFSTLIWMLSTKVIYYSEHPEILNKLIAAAQTFIGNNFDQQTFTDLMKKVSEWAMGLFSGFLDSTLNLLLIFSMMYFFLYYMLTKHQVFEATLVKYMPFREKNVSHFADELKTMTFANVVGQGLIALAQGIFMGIGFVIFGIPDPVFWSLICFFFSFLPVIGSAGVFLPAGLIEIASGNSGNGIGLILYGFIVVANVDNVLRLWLNKWLGNIHPLVTITGIVIGIPLFGILGLVFGPLLISIFILLVRLFEAAYVDYTPEKERIVEKEELESGSD